MLPKLNELLKTINPQQNVIVLTYMNVYSPGEDDVERHGSPREVESWFDDDYDERITEHVLDEYSVRYVGYEHDSIYIEATVE